MLINCHRPKEACHQAINGTIHFPIHNDCTTYKGLEQNAKLNRIAVLDISREFMIIIMALASS